MSLKGPTLIIKDNEKVICDISDEWIASALRYADVDQLERRKWYSRLYFVVFGCPNVRPIYLINRAVKKYSIPLEQVLPFLKFALKEYGILSQQEKEEMLSLKNSLIIMNHFNKTS